MLIKKGIPVSPGVAITKAVVIDAEDQPVPRRVVTPAQVPAEIKRFEQALQETRKDIERQRAHAAAKVGDDLAKIFDVHRGMLEDKAILDQIRGMVQQERVSAEYAVFAVLRDWAHKFQKSEVRYLRERANDIWDLERQLLGHLIGRKRAELDKLKFEAAVIAHDLTPSQTAAMDREKILAIATDAGGRTSHTAILAHALGIPAIVGLEDLTAEVNSGDTIIVDANNGLVIVNPDAGQLMEYLAYVHRMETLATELGQLSKLPAVTQDQTQITISANIEFPEEVEAALEKGGTGVGLYRTEFLFLTGTGEATEEQQYEAYALTVKKLKGKPLTIRTLDLGADKVTGNAEVDGEREHNPFLGCRSIRLCLQNLPLFKTQLRAILRASTLGPCRIMFPMISNIMELRQAKMVLQDVMEDLDDQGIEYRRKIPVGIMIEVPSAAIQSPALARECDFFSIGTNDLVQYTVAVDRGNERIASLYSPAHPAVIQLIKDVVRAANRAKIDCSICGEMAGQPEYTMLLLGVGLRHLSIAPPAIPEIKRIIRAVTLGQCQRVARKAGSFDYDREVLHYLQDEMRRIIPDALDGRSIES